MKWLNQIPGHPLPYYTFIADEREYLALMKRMGVAKPYRWINEGAHGTTHYHMYKKLGDIAVVCIDRAWIRTAPLYVLAGLIAHEAWHVWEKYMEMIDERKPSSEFSAYGMERIVEELMREAVRFRK
jgi:hypothetical protein